MILKVKIYLYIVVTTVFGFVLLILSRLNIFAVQYPEISNSCRPIPRTHTHTHTIKRAHVRTHAHSK